MFDDSLMNDNGFLLMVNVCEVIDCGKYFVVILDNCVVVKVMICYLIEFGYICIVMIKGFDFSLLM